MATVRRKRPTKKRDVRRGKRKSVSGTMPRVVSGIRRIKRKKVSGLSISKNPMIDTLIGVGIGVGVGMAMNKFVPIENGNMKAAGITGAGGIIDYLGSQQNSPLLKGIGYGTAAIGASKMAQQFGVLQGVTDFMSGIGLIDETDDVMFIEMNGLDEQNMMNGPNQMIPMVSSVGSDMPSVISSPK